MRGRSSNFSLGTVVEQGADVQAYSRSLAAGDSQPTTKPEANAPPASSKLARKQLEDRFPKTQPCSIHPSTNEIRKETARRNISEDSPLINDTFRMSFAHIAMDRSTHSQSSTVLPHAHLLAPAQKALRSDQSH